MRSLPKMGFGFVSSSLIAEISAIRMAFRPLFSMSSNFSYPPRLEFSQVPLLALMISIKCERPRCRGRGQKLRG